MTKFYMLWAVAALWASTAFAQCPPPVVNAPAAACQGQPATFSTQETGPPDWDFTPGDALTQPTATNPGGLTGSGRTNATQVVKADTSFIQLVSDQNANAIRRVNYGQFISNTPRVTNVTLGAALASPTGLRVVQSGGQTVGFVVSTFNTINRLVFDANLQTVTSQTALSLSGAVRTIVYLDVVNDQGNWYVVAISRGPVALEIIPLGNSLLNAPGTTVSLPLSGTPSDPGMVSLHNDCTDWYAFVSAYSGGFSRFRLGASLATVTNATPLPLSVPAFGVSVVHQLYLESGRYQLFQFGNGGLARRLDFGSSLGSSPTVTDLGTFAGAAQLRGVAAVRSNTGNLYFLGSTDDYKLVRFAFGQGSTGATPSGANGPGPHNISFTNPGRRPYVLTVNDYGRYRQIIDSITVLPAPRLGININQQCTGQPVTFSSTSTGPVSNVNFTFSDGGSGTGANVTRTFTAAGTYTVTVQGVATNNCVVSFTRSFKIFDPPATFPSSAFSLPANACAFDSVSITDQSTWAGGTIVRWFYDFGNGQTSTLRNPKVAYNSPGQYTVTLTASDSSGCGNPTTRTITIQGSPRVNFGARNLCFGETVQFSDSTTFVNAGTPQTYEWTFGDRNSSSGVNPQHTYAAPGLYNVTLRVTNTAGCGNTVSRQIRIFEKPVVTADIPALTFLGTPVTFVGNVSAPNQAISQVRWNFGDPLATADSVSTALNTSHLYPQAGTYRAILTVVTNEGCSTTAYFTVRVAATCPTAAFDAPATLPTNAPVPITNTTQNAQTYTWDFCAGDLEQPLVGKTTQLPFTGAAVPSYVKDQNGNWFGFVPYSSLANTNSNQFVRFDYGNSLKNAPSSLTLGSPMQVAGAGVSAISMAFHYENGNWYALSGNVQNNQFFRLDFGASLGNIPLGNLLTYAPGSANPLNRPFTTQIVRDGDSLYAFVTNSLNTLSTGNIARLSFGTSITNVPAATTLDNPAALQNSAGMAGLAIFRDCNQWFGIATSANGQVYRLRFGTSLSNRRPTGENITNEMNQGLTSGTLGGANSVRIAREKGVIHTVITTSAGQIIIHQFANGLGAAPTKLVPGTSNLGVLKDLLGSTLVQDGTEWNLFATDNLSNRLYKLEFLNICSASQPFVVTDNPTPPSVTYSSAGTYYISLLATDSLGLAGTTRDSVVVGGTTGGVASCLNPAAIGVPPSICANGSLTVAVGVPAAINGELDACAGDLAQLPLVSAANQAQLPVGVSGMAVVPVDTFFVSLGVNAGNNELFRWRSPGSDLNTTPQGFTNFGALLNNPTDIAVVRQEDGLYYGLVTQQSANSLAVLNFGSNLATVTASQIQTSVLFSVGNLNRPVAVQIIREQGRYYGVVVNNSPSGIAVLDFGLSLQNAPRITSYPMLEAASAQRISLVKDCGVWAGLVTDQTNPGLVQVVFANGLDQAPTLTRVRQSLLPGLTTPNAINIGRDAGEFFAFIQAFDQSNVFRLNLGTSLRDTVYGNFATLGNFGVNLTQSPNARLIKMRDSRYIYVSVSNGANRLLVRLLFPNDCGANLPLQTGNPSTYQPLRYNSPGRRIVTFTGEGGNGSVISLAETLQVTTPVQPNFTTVGSRCIGSPIAFLDQTQVDNPSGASRQWFFGDTTAGIVQSTALNPAHTYARPGTYSVTLRVTDGSGCVSTSSRSVRVFAKPVPAFSIAQVCSFDSAQITNLTVANGDTIATWVYELREAGGATIATYNTAAPRIYIPGTGQYELRLRVVGRNGCDTTTAWQPYNVTQQGTPLDFTTQAGSTCFGDTTRFVNLIPAGTPQVLSTVWDFGNGQGSSDANPNYYFGIRGSYNVRLTVVNILGCTNSITKTITLTDSPQGLIATNNLPCMNNPTGFEVQNVTGGGTITSYLWDFGDTTTATGPRPLKTYTRTGTFNVTVRLTSSSGCSSTLATTVTVNPSPQADFSWAGSCVNSGIQFTSTSSAAGVGGGITAYLWDFGNGQSSSAQNPQAVYASAGTYRVTLTVTAGDCPNTTFKDVTILPEPIVRIGREDGCIGIAYRFIDSSLVGGQPDPASTRQWEINGQVYNGPTVDVVLPESQLPYVVRLTVTSSGGCTQTTVQTVTVGNAPAADFRFRDTVFTQEPWRLRVENRSLYAVRYLWEWGDGTTSTSAAPDHIYAQPGIYTVRLTAIGTSRCSTVAERVLSIVPNAQANLALTRVTALPNGANRAISVELNNRGNVELRAIDLALTINAQTTVVERWTGILLPGTTTTYVMRSQLAAGQDPTDGICVTGRPVNRADIDSSNNRFCLSTGPNFRLIDIRPNPVFAGNVTVAFNVPEAGSVGIFLVDMAGRRVRTLTDSYREAGFYDLSVPLGNLAAGVYHVQAVLNDQVVTRRVVVQ